MSDPIERPDDIVVNNRAVLVVPASFAEGKKIKVNNGSQLYIVPDMDER
jgi:hypothetical protein